MATCDPDQFEANQTRIQQTLNHGGRVSQADLANVAACAGQLPAATRLQAWITGLYGEEGPTPLEEELPPPRTTRFGSQSLQMFKGGYTGKGDVPTTPEEKDWAAGYNQLMGSMGGPGTKAFKLATAPSQDYGTVYNKVWQDVHDRTPGSEEQKTAAANAAAAESGSAVTGMKPWQPTPATVDLPDLFGSTGGDQTAPANVPGADGATDLAVPGVGSEFTSGLNPSMRGDIATDITLANQPANPGAGMDLMGGAPWMKTIGMDPLAPLKYNPLENPEMYLNMFGQTQDQPGYFGAQNAELYKTLPGLYSLNNPGGRVLSPHEVAGFASEFGEGGLFGTPGQYLDTGATWDELMGTGGTATGQSGLVQSDMATLEPDQQIGVVAGALESLSPWMMPDAATNMKVKLAQASERWKQASVLGQYSGDFFSWLRDEEGAEGWM